MSFGNNRVHVGSAHNPAPSTPQGAARDTCGQCSDALEALKPSGSDTEGVIIQTADLSSSDVSSPKALSSDSPQSSRNLSPMLPVSLDAEDLIDDPRPSVQPLRVSDEEDRPQPPRALITEAFLYWPRFGVLAVYLLLAAVAFVFAQGQHIHRLVPPREVMALFSKEAILAANSHEKRPDAFDRVAIWLYYAVGSLIVLIFVIQLLALPVWEVRRRNRGDHPRKGGTGFQRFEPQGRLFWYRFAVAEGIQDALQIGRLCMYGGFDVVTLAQVQVAARPVVIGQAALLNVDACASLWLYYRDKPHHGLVLAMLINTGYAFMPLLGLGGYLFDTYY